MLHYLLADGCLPIHHSTMREEMGHYKEITILSCSFNGRECSPEYVLPFRTDTQLSSTLTHAMVGYFLLLFFKCFSDFSTTQSTDYGNCFVFNSPELRNHSLQSQYAGIKYGNIEHFLLLETCTSQKLIHEIFWACSCLGSPGYSLYSACCGSFKHHVSFASPVSSSSSFATSHQQLVFLANQRWYCITVDAI